MEILKLDNIIITLKITITITITNYQWKILLLFGNKLLQLNLYEKLHNQKNF